MSDYFDDRDEEEINRLATKQEKEAIKMDLKVLETTSLTGLQSFTDMQLHTQNTMQAHRTRMVSQDLEINRRLSQTAQQQIPLSSAQEAAPGSPVQVMAPERVGLKKWVERSIHTRRARRVNSRADYVSYDIHNSMEEQRQRYNNALKLYNPAGQEDPIEGDITGTVTQTRSGKTIHLRGMREFTYGFKVKSNGEPVSGDEENARKDRIYVNDYLSGDLEKRRPHLERIVNEMLNLKVDASQLRNEHYFKNHFREIFNTSQKITCFDNIMADPINAEFFENLPQIQKDMLAAQRNKLTQFGYVCTCLIGTHHITANGDYMKENEDTADEFNRMAESQLPGLEQEQERSAQLENEACEREAERRLDNIYSGSYFYSSTGTDRERLEAPGRESSTLERDTMQRMRDIISENPYVYNHYEDVISFVFSDASRSYKLRKNLVDQRAGYQYLLEKMDTEENKDSYENVKTRETMRKKIDQADKDLESIDSQISICMDTLRFFCDNQPLTDRAAQMLDLNGLSDFVQRRQDEYRELENRRAARESSRPAPGSEGNDGAQ